MATGPANAAMSSWDTAGRRRRFNPPAAISGGRGGPEEAEAGRRALESVVAGRVRLGRRTAHDPDPDRVGASRSGRPRPDAAPSHLAERALVRDTRTWTRAAGATDGDPELVARDQAPAVRAGDVPEVRSGKRYPGARSGNAEAGRAFRDPPRLRVRQPGQRLVGLGLGEPKLIRGEGERGALRPSRRVPRRECECGDGQRNADGRQSGEEGSAPAHGLSLKAT